MHMDTFRSPLVAGSGREDPQRNRGIPGYWVMVSAILVPLEADIGKGFVGC